MSTSRQPPSPDSGGNPTRQMLDELDALMERMLSLPVEGLDTPIPEPPQSLLTMEDAPAAAPPEPLPAASTAPGTLETHRQSAPAAELPTQFQTGWQSAPPPITPPPLQGPHMWPVAPGKIIVGRLSAPPVYSPPSQKETIEKKPQANEPAHEQPLGLATEPHPADLLPPLIVRPAGQRADSEGARRLPAKRRSIFGAGFRLLLGLNQTFDRTTTWLGGPGKRLRSTRGRHLLGIAGLALLALAIVWCLHDWLGWNWFKVSLE